MGLLDDLRQQAESLKAKEDVEKNRQEKAEEYYRQHINPKMAMIFKTLVELTKHLNYVKPDIKAPYRFNEEGLVLELKQHEYKVQVDSTEFTKLITLNMNCEFPKEIVFVSKEAVMVEKNVRYLNKYSLQYQVKRNKDENFNVVGAQFVVAPAIRINFVFKAEVEKGCISLAVDNFDGLGSHVFELKPEKITDEYLDQLGRYLIRENKNMFQETIDDEAKERIRAQILAEQQSRQKELDEADKISAEEEAKKREQSVKSQLLKKIKNINVPPNPFANLKKQRNA